MKFGLPITIIDDVDEDNPSNDIAYITSSPKKDMGNSHHANLKAQESGKKSSPIAEVDITNTQGQGPGIQECG